MSTTPVERPDSPSNGRNLKTEATRVTSEDSEDFDSNATQSEDEPDWNAERVAEIKAETKVAKRGRRAYLLFMKLAKPLRTFVYMIFGSAVLVAPYLVFEFRFKNSAAKPQVTAWSLWLTVSWALGCVTAFLTDLTPRVTTALFLAFYDKPPEQLPTYIELFMAVSTWIKLALNISWGWITLGLIRTIVKPPGTYWVTVDRVVQAFFAAGLIFLAEKLFLHFVAIKFHQKALAERLHENQLALRALDKLYNAHNAARRRFKTSRKGSPSTAAVLSSIVTSPIQTSGLNTPHEKKHESNKGHDKKKRAQFVEALGDAVAQIALKDSRYNKHAKLGSVYNARRLANQLFADLQSIAPPRDCLTVDDFYPFFRSPSDASQAFHIFDKDGNGDITRKEMRQSVQGIYRERKALTSALKDISSAVAKLDGVCIAVALIIIGFICLLLFSRKNTVESLVPLATIILGFSFIFGNSAMMLFESMIFIFSTHPFDVGDLVIIDDTPLLVKEFGLFSTVFRRMDGQEMIAPNSQLANSKLILNVRRSSSMWEYTTITVGFDTPLEMLEQLKRKLRAYMAANNREWGTPGVELNIDKMDNQNAISIIIAMEHRANWQDWGGRWTRRNAFMKHLKGVLEELEIGYSLPPQPIFIRPSSVPPPWARDDRGRSNSDLGNAAHVQGLGRGPSNIHSMSLPQLNTI